MTPPFAARSMYLQVVVSVATSTLLFFTGAALWTYYASRPDGMPVLAKNDQILPVFIANGLPPGVAGCALAAIAAATLSTLAANLNSAAAAFTTDFYRRLALKGRKDERRELRCGKVCTVLAGLLGGGFAIVLANGNLASAYEQFQRYTGMLTAGLGALFFMGIFMKRVNGFGAVCGLAANYAVTFGLDLLPWPGKPHMLLYGFFGLIVCLAVAWAAGAYARGRAVGMLLRPHPRDASARQGDFRPSHLQQAGAAGRTGCDGERGAFVQLQGFDDRSGRTFTNWA